MFSIIFWLIIIIVYIGVGLLIGNEKVSYIIIFLSGMVVLLINLYNSLQKKSLGLYFWTLRKWHHFKNSKAKWWLLVRYDGHYSSDILNKFKELLMGNSNNWETKIKNFSIQSIDFIIQDSLNFYAELSFGRHTNLPYDYLTIELSAIEIGYNDSVEKLNTEIIPLLETFTNFFKPENQSFDFHIEFQRSNPFFALYINHLKPESIKDFHVYLHVKEYSVTQKADTVQIDKKKICITTQSTNALKELAKDFLLLSPQVKKLVKQ